MAEESISRLSECFRLYSPCFSEPRSVGGIAAVLTVSVVATVDRLVIIGAVNGLRCLGRSRTRSATRPRDGAARRAAGAPGRARAPRARSRARIRGGQPRRRSGRCRASPGARGRAPAGRAPHVAMEGEDRGRAGQVVRVEPADGGLSSWPIITMSRRWPNSRAISSISQCAASGCCERWLEVLAEVMNSRSSPVMSRTSAMRAFERQRTPGEMCWAVRMPSSITVR